MNMIISIDEACRILKDCYVDPVTEEKSISEVYNRVLAQDVSARMSVPPFDKSAFDGYALRAEDTVKAGRETPIELKIVGEIPAGKTMIGAVPEGCAVKILTGAMIPEGADAVIRFEDVEASDTVLRLYAPVLTGNIIGCGEDVEAGNQIAVKGTVIDGAVQAMLASQGMENVQVYKIPQIGIISTGSELCRPGEKLAPGKIYSSSMYLLGGYMQRIGAETLDCGIVEDDPEKLKWKIRECLKHCDMLVLTGGASVGDYDYSKPAVRALGGEFLFEKICFKPGGTMFAATVDGKVVLGLSGNPGAAAVGLLLIGTIYVKRLCGRCDLEWESIQARLKYPLKKRSVITRILRGRIEYSDDKIWFCENRCNGNGSVYSLMECNLLGIIPEGSDELPEGTVIEAKRIFI